MSPVLTIVSLVCLSMGRGPVPAFATSGRPDTLRVLFVGNSHTAVHDVPGIVAALARSAGRELLAEQVVISGASLGDHLRDGRALERIEESGWDVVVLQQGPSALPESQEALLGFARELAGPIRESGAVPALYAVWPSGDRPDDFSASSESYRLAAEAIGALLLPCGLAWTEAWELDPELALYGADGVHASKAGAYLVALVIYGALFDADPRDLPSGLLSRAAEPLPFLDHPTARTLEEAAARVLGATGPRIRAGVDSPVPSAP